MKKNILTYLSVLGSLFILDFVWLILFMLGVFTEQNQAIVAESFLYIPIIIYYFLYSFGICYFVVYRHYEANWARMSVCISGLFLGLVTYGAYNLTNYATLKGWSFELTIIGVCWGTIMTSIAALIGYIVMKKLTKSIYFQN